MGKTSIKIRYFGNMMDEKTIPGGYIATKQLGEGQVIEIWDPSMEDFFHSSKEIKTQFYSNPLAVLLMYDVTKPRTFENIPNWISELIEYNQNQLVPMVLIASKTDLRDSMSSISTLSGLEYAEEISKWAQIKVPYIEVSVPEDKGFDKIIDFLFNLEYFIKFFKTYQSEDRERIFLAEKVYQKVSQDTSQEFNSFDYFEYIQTHGGELKEFLDQKIEDEKS